MPSFLGYISEACSNWPSRCAIWIQGGHLSALKQACSDIQPSETGEALEAFSENKNIYCLHLLTRLVLVSVTFVLTRFCANTSWTIVRNRRQSSISLVISVQLICSNATIGRRQIGHICELRRNFMALIVSLIAVWFASASSLHIWQLQFRLQTIHTEQVATACFSEVRRIKK